MFYQIQIKFKTTVCFTAEKLLLLESFFTAELHTTTFILLSMRRFLGV